MRGPCIGLDFEAIGVIATSQTFPEVECGKAVDTLKLMNVGDLVQEQRRIELCVRSKKHGVTNGNTEHTTLPQCPSADSRWQSTAPPVRYGESRMTPQQLVGQRKCTSDHRGTYSCNQQAESAHCFRYQLPQHVKRVVNGVVVC